MSKKPWEEVGMTEEDYNRAFQQLQSGFNQQKDKNTSILDKVTFGTKGDVNRRAYEAASMSYDDFVQGDTYEELAKRYSEKGKMAMDDTIGKVAARTGGIASSYATQAGQQAYGDWMTRLEETARAMYDSERQEAMDRYALSKGVLDMRNSEIDSQNKRSDEIRKQIQENDDRAALEAEAAQRDASDEIIMRLAAGESINDMSDLIEQSGRSAAYWNAYATLPTSDTEELEEPEEETVSPYYKYAYVGDKGVVYHDQNGKEVTVAEGYNPYTRTKNPDAENGVMDNGYQPDNIDGKKVTIYKGGVVEFSDGSEADIYFVHGDGIKMSTGKYYYWDDYSNEYVEIPKSMYEELGLGVTE